MVLFSNVSNWYTTWVIQFLGREAGNDKSVSNKEAQEVGVKTVYFRKEGDCKLHLLDVC